MKSFNKKTATVCVCMYNASHSYVKISVFTELMIWMRERERDAERVQSRIENCCYKNIDFESCVSIIIVGRQNRDSYTNRYLHAPLSFLPIF